MTHGMIAPTEIKPRDLHAEVVAEFELYIGMSYDLFEQDARQNGLTIIEADDERISASAQ